MARYDDYKLKDLAKNENIVLSGNLFSDVDSIRVEYVLNNAGTVDYPKRELTYDEAYRILEFRKKYDSTSTETGGEEFGNFSVGAVSAVLVVAVLLIVKFFKYPGKWLFVPVLSVVTLLLSTLSSYVRMIIEYQSLPSGKALSINFVKIYSWIVEQSFVLGIVFAVILSLALTLLLYPITKKLNARIRKNFILTKGDRVGSYIFLISSIILFASTFLCWAMKYAFGGNPIYINDLFKVFSAFSHHFDFSRYIGALWMPLFVAAFIMMLGILLARKREKACAILSIFFPLIFISIEIIRLFAGYPRFLNIYRTGDLFVHFNSSFLHALSERGICSEVFCIVTYLLIASLYFVFVGITLLKKSEKLYCFTRGLGHLDLLLHLITLFAFDTPFSYNKNVTPLQLFRLVGFGFVKYRGVTLYIPVRIAFFLLYALLIWAVNMILAKKCDVSE